MGSKLNESYRLVNEGKMAKVEFLRQTRQSFPNYINQFTSYDDAVTILRNKGMLSEDVVCQCLGDKFPIEQIDKGIRIELEKMGLTSACIPSPEEYKKAKKVTIDNLSKNALHYVTAGTDEDTSVVKQPKENKNSSDQMQKVKLQESKASEEEDRVKVQFKAKYGLAGWKKKYEKYLAQRKEKDLKEGKLTNQTKAEFSHEELDKIKSQFKRKYGIHWESKFNSYIKQHFAKEAEKKEKKDVVQESQNQENSKEMQLLREAIEKTIVKIINEAATVSLTKLSDDNASIQGIPGLLNSLESVVTEIESFILKEQSKIQSIFAGVGDIKNEDGIPIGYRFAEPILDAFKEDLRPVLDKINFNNIKVPEAPKDLEQTNPEQGQEPLSSDEGEKKSVFSPKGLKPDPLAESKKIVKKGRYTII